MKTKSKLAPLLALNLVLAGMVGCASNNIDPYLSTLAEPKEEKSLLLNPSLEKGKNWELKFYPSTNESNLVYKKTSSGDYAWLPKGELKSDVNCFSGYLGLYPSKCETNTVSDDFTVRKFGPLEAARSILTIPIGTLFSPLFLIPNDEHDITFNDLFLVIPQTGEFSYKKYATAFKQAKIKDSKTEEKFNNNYRSVVQLYKDINNQLAAYNVRGSSTSYSYQALLRANERNLKADYERKILDNLEINIVDNSGLLRSNQGISIYKNDYLEANAVINHGLNLNAQNNSFIFGIQGAIKGPISLSELHKKLTDYKKELAAQHKNITPALNKLNTSNASVNLTAKKHTINHTNNLNISWGLPKNINPRNSSSNLNANLYINSIDYRSILPNYFSLNKNQIRLEVNGDTLTISNSSSDYIDIKSLTVYVDTKIHTQHLTGINKSLPPNAEQSFNLSVLGLGKAQLGKNYLGMTRARAQNTSLKYGLAIKYTTTGSSSEKSVFDTKTYRLVDILN